MKHFKRRWVAQLGVQSVRATRAGRVMKSLVAAVALCAVAVLGAPQRPQDQQAVITRQDSDISPDGSFTYTYETSNGIRADARGQQVGPESLSVQGQFSYTADDGTPIQLQYVADENGYQPQGAHLPTPPPIPEAILKSIEFNRQNPEPQEGQPQLTAATRRFG